jgi:hypothetical protein
MDAAGPGSVIIFEAVRRPRRRPVAAAAPGPPPPA